MFILLFLLSVVSGFFLAGFSGALLFGLFNTLAVRSMQRKTHSPIVYLAVFPIFSLLGYFLMIAFGLLGASETAHRRVEAIRTELKEQGHTPMWFIISEKRSSLYNRLLLNSRDKSKHLMGRAIDVYVIDIDGDGDYDGQDYKLIEKAAAKVSRATPELSGKTYHYLDKGLFSRRMVHVELK